MAARAAGQLVSGLVVGAAVGATVALVLASRADTAVAGKGSAAVTGPTRFAPANLMLARTRQLFSEVREQVRVAVAEGKRTAAETRADLNRRFDDAKHGKQT